MPPRRSKPPPLSRREACSPGHRRTLPAPLHLEAEFLPDDLVLLDATESFLDERFVIEDDSESSTAPDVIFAGPSDPPPALSVQAFAALGKAEAPRGWRMGYVAGVLGFAGVAAVVMAVVHGGSQPTSSSTPTPTATTTATPTTTSTSTLTSTPTDLLDAAEAKRLAQRALDRGDAKAAIEQGERSVDIDSADAETWLILGAAFMQRGNYAKERRCFSSCVQLAKRGARGECAALLR